MVAPLLIVILGGAYIAYAQLYDDAFVVNTIQIFPSEVSATGWHNIETVTFQNLDEDSLSQAFNKSNSAWLKTGNAIQIEFENQQENSLDLNAILEPTETTTPTPQSNEPVQVENENDYLDSTSPTSESQTVPADGAEAEPTPATETETVVMKRAESLFALAVGVLTEQSLEQAQTTIAQTDASEATINLDTTQPISQTDTEATVVEDNDIDTTELELELGPESEATETETETAQSDEEQAVTESSCGDDCLPYSITLADFGYPLDQNANISGAHLRLSFAALKKSTVAHVPEFTVQYSINSGYSWMSAGAISIVDEVSNSINGGYYLFALPEVLDQTALDNLTVRLVYQDDPAILNDLYLDAVWLELFTVEPPEENKLLDIKDLLADDGFDSEPMRGDVLTLPNGETLTFNFTDENADENLIIKSSEKTYRGLTKSRTYFSVTNTSDDVDEFNLQAYFPDGVGEVTSLKEFTKNVPRKEVIPEYRPYVYYCDTGWEYTGAVENDPEEFALDLSFEVEDSNYDAGVRDVEEDTSTEEAILAENEAAALEQESTPEAFDDSTSLEVEESSDKELEAVQSEVSTEDKYSCRNTSVVRVCDGIEADGDACVVNNVKVAEHTVTKYAPGWIERLQKDGSLPQPNLLKRVANFFGFGPDTKAVPQEFEARAHTPDTYEIQPGETKYFEMEITFPQFSEGEYWIEAIGKSEYGLLDPFWSSSWLYKMPITIDNTGGSEDLSEHQVFLELDSSLTDFWTNVAADGSDIRFVQEFSEGSNDESWLSLSWTDRIPITIQASEVDGDLTDFPVYVNLADLGAEFFAGVKGDGSDIRITAGDGKTEMPYELVSISTSTMSGELHFRADDISSSNDTTFYIYYGNAAATAYGPTDLYGSQNVWSNNFESRYAMDDSPASSGAQDDSTNNNNDAVAAAGMTIADLVDGQIGTAIDFDGTGDVMTFGTPYAFTGQFTISGWWNYDAVGFALAGPAGTNEKWGPWNSGGANMFVRTISSSDTSVPNPSIGNWHHVVLTRDASNVVRLYIDGGTPNTLYGGAAQNGTSDWVNFGGESGQQYNGRLDEMRFADIQRSSSWISTEYNNQSNTSSFYATSSPEVFTYPTFAELDHWVQHFDNTADEADIWVQIESLPANASTTIYLYYGNNSASSASDEFAPFTHSTLQDTYYVLDTDSSGDIEVYSLIDNNQVQLDSGTITPLNAGETVALTGYTGSSVIRTLGPISVTVNDAGADTVAPIAFATTTVLVPTNRNTQTFDIISPFASTTVRIYEGASGTAASTNSLATGTVQNIATDIVSGTQGAVIEAGNPILVRHVNAGGSDSLIPYPPTTRDIFGIRSNSLYVSAVVSNPDPTIYCSGGSSATVTGILRGERQAVTTCGNGAEGTGEASRFTNVSTPIAAIQQGDGDGSESSSFLSQHEFSTQYYLPTDTAYVAVVCSPRFGAATIEIQSNDGQTVLDSDTCTPNSSTSPGKAYLNNGLDGTVLAFSAGSRVISTNGVPFYVMYEDDEEQNDETNLWGAVQGRQYAPLEYGYTFGAQELNIDAQYTQNSHMWFENADSLTPTVPWDLGDDGVVNEGDDIINQGAVTAGEELRLRMNLSVANATGSAGTTIMKLQYTAADTCELPENTWFDVGAIGSTTAAFSGYENASVADGATLPGSLLASTTEVATYEEGNPSEFLPNQLLPGDFVEYDWVLTNSNAATNQNYCFRMIRYSGSPLDGYTAYPQLVTSGPPDAPTLLVFFDNEHTPENIPVLEFVTTDTTGDDIDYQVQIDNDPDFSSVTIDRNSITHFLQFENLNNISDKSPFNSGDRMRFTGLSSLATSTYYWRVRAIDPGGSNTYGDWSETFSFTVNASVTVSEWLQTTGDQFSTDTLISLSTSSGAVSVVGSSGELTTTAIDFDDATVGNAWGSVAWSDTETSGNITYQVQYYDGSSWTLIPNTEIPNNSIGIGTSPINLLDLDTDVYNEIRIVATFSGTTLSIQDLTVSWGQKIQPPELQDPFDHEKIADDTPTLSFVTTDPQGDDLIYEVSYSTSASFVSSTTVETATTTSGIQTNYTIPSTLSNGQTYWWRARARDPLGDNSYSDWSDADAFTIDTSVVVSTWFQTTNEQFRENDMFGLEASGGSVTITDEIGEYGTVDVSGNSWVEISTLRSYSNMVVVASPEYAGSTNDHRSPRVRNKTADTFEIKVDDDDGSFSGTTTIDYIVMEAGTWTLADGGSGVQVVAGTEENVTDVKAAAYSNSGSSVVSFSPSFGAAPAAFATVSSDNDTSWVSTHIDDGSNRSNEVTTSLMGLSLGRQRATGVHDPENIDYVVIGIADGTNNSTSFEAFKSGNSITCCNSGDGQNYQSAFSTAPAVTIVHSNGTNGGDGTTVYKELDTVSTNSTLYMNAGEIGPGSGTHASEVVSIAAFEGSSGILLRSTTGSLTGTMYSEAIPFSDGAGPKFEEFSWNDSEPGGSTLRYQVQYYNGSTWALIPNGDLPGNSTGTTTGPIDLSSLNVGTYHTIRLVANFTCSGATCPTLQDWQVEWSEGVVLSGTAFEYDRTSPVGSGGTVRVAVNGALQANTGTISAGVWSINNVTAFAGDTVTIFVDDVPEEDEAVNVFVYDGVGDMEDVVLYKQHLTFNSNEKATTTNALLAAYDYSVSADEDIFFDVDANNDLTVCAQGNCATANLYIGSGHLYIPDSASSGNVEMYSFINYGRVKFDGNTARVAGSWYNNATTTMDTSTVIFTATSSAASNWYDQNWSHRIPVTIQGSAIDANLSDFPVYVDLSDLGSTFFSTVRADGGDIRVTTSNGTTELAREVVSINTGAQTGELHFNANYLSASSDTRFYIYFGNASSTDYATTDTFGAENVWSNGYEVVYHFDESPSAGSPQYIDSTGNSAGTAVNMEGGDRIVGAAGFAADIDGADERIETNYNGSMLWSTWSIFLNSDGTQGTCDGTIFSRGANVSGINVGGCQAANELGYHWNDDSSSWGFGGGPVYPTDEWFMAAMVVEPTQATLYSVTSGGVTSGTNSIAHATGTINNLDFGWDSYGTARSFDGTMDEARLSAVARSIDWLTAEFRNLATSTAFYATSSVQLYSSTADTYKTLDDADGVLDFYNLVFGETSGAATWIPQDPLDVNRNLTVAYGTLNRDGKNISVARSLATGVGGYWSGTGTTTFDGTGLANWSDANPILQNIGTAIVNGTGKTLTMTSSVRASSIAIQPSNTLNGESFSLYLSGDFTNAGTFVPQTSTVVIDGNAVNAVITTGGSSLYNLTASTTNGGMVSFSNSTVGLLGNLTIATGTVNLPTTLLTVAGSLNNIGGYFVHNNGEVRFTGTGSKTVFANGSGFFNNFYTLAFAGSGSYTFTDANATTTTLSITNGNVTLPSGQFTVSGDFLTSGTGAFNHNNGTVILPTQDNDSITTNGSALNNVIIQSGGVTGSWYDNDFEYRLPITVSASAIDADLANFPVLLNLADLPSEFFDEVRADGGDIRITEGDGQTEVPREIVSINVGSEIGELYFRATNLSSATNTTFYLYYGNAAASDYADNHTYGAQNVWSNGFVMVEHMDDLTTSSLLNSVNSSLNGSKEASNNPIETASGRIYEAQDFVDDDVAHGNLLGSASNFSFAGWFYADNLTGSGDTATYGYSIFGVSPSSAPYTWLTAGGSGYTTELRLCAWENTATACTGTSGAGLTTGNWYYVSVSATIGGVTTVRVNGAPVLSYTNDGEGSMGTNFTLGDLRPARNINFDGRLDEIRVGSVTRTAAWQDASYRNQATTTSFYSVGAVDSGYTRSFADANATIAGTLTIGTNAAAVLPSGTLTVGGSLDNDGIFAATGGTIAFNSATGTETISFGNSSPANLSFNSVTGDWTIIDSATTTGNVTLTSVGDFTLQSGATLYVGGQFTNSANGLNTDWTGSTLVLAGGTDYSINSKTDSGDFYNVLRLIGDGDISMWNSSANTYDLQNTSSLYSQDHDANNGDLYIFGDYERSTGTEHWSYATDFDGASLSGGNERPVSVSIASGTSVTIATSSLSILGDANATTTVLSQAGTYALTLSLATLNAQYFTIADTNPAGLALLASTTVAIFSNGQFDIAAGSSAVTVDTTTVDANPAIHIYDVGFVTAGGDTNVTLTGGVPVSYWWFRDGTGNRYGESYDADNGNPGAIRFDDSTYGITISGVVYSDDGVTPLGTPLCDDVTPIVKAVVDGGSSFSAACSSVDSSYTISGVTFSGDPDITVYINSNGAASQPTAVTLRSETTGAGGTAAGTGNFTVNRAATIANGDVLVVIIGKDDSPAITAPAGWTTGDTLGSSVQNLVRTGIWYKRVTDAANEPTSYTFTGDASESFSYWSGALTNVDVITPQDVSFAGRWANSTNDTTPNAASVTTATNGAYVLAASYIDTDNSVTAPTAPWATRGVNIVGSDNNNLVVSSRSIATPAATGQTTVNNVAGGSESNNGQFAFRRVTYAASTVYGAVVTRAPITDITDLDIYQNRIITRHEDATALSIASMAAYDNGDDTDVPFAATVGSPDTLVVEGGNGLYIWNDTTFTPDGNVTLTPNGNGSLIDGTLSISDNATFVGQTTESHNIGGSLTLGTNANLIPASSTITMTATSSGKLISSLAASPLSLHNIIFSGGGQWGVTADLSLTGNMQVSAGTVNGTGDITLETGSLYGNGIVAMTGGTTQIKQTNTFGGTSNWSFNSLLLGGVGVGTTTPAAVSTTTVYSTLTIAAGHTLAAGANTYELAGSGSVFIENGALREDTSMIIYSGSGANVAATAYYNLSLNSFAGPATYVAPSTGLLIQNNLFVGQSAGNSTFNINTNDPTVTVGGAVSIGANGVISGSNSNILTVAGDWTNAGTFTANGGQVVFAVPASATINPGNSVFANLSITGAGTVLIAQNATATANMSISSSSAFTQAGGTVLAVGGTFTNNTDGANTTWTGSTLALYSGTQFAVNDIVGEDTYHDITIYNGTHPRFWSSSFNSVSTAASSSVYSMDHGGVDGNLYVFGDYINDIYDDYWSYATDFDGSALGSPRQANVYVEGGGSVTYTGGGLYVAGDSTASTTIQNQGSGTYGLSVTDDATVLLQYAIPRDLQGSGVVFAGTPTVLDISNSDFLVETNSASALTVAGSVINQNPALNLNRNGFSDDIGVSGAINVTVTGSSVSSWRFTNEYGDIAGEAFDADTGDPGEIVWSNSAALITVSGRVYSDEGSTPSSVCDGSTQAITMVVAGLTLASTSCDGTGLYTFNNVGFSPSDSIIVYINDATATGSAITVDPISNILNMHVYENRVIMRHESTDPIRISDLEVWDKNDDAKVPFDAELGSPNTLVLDANTKLLVWTAKTFTPDGNVTVPGGGSGGAHDGTLEVMTNARFTATGNETHTIGGSFTFAAGALFTPASSNVILTTSGAGRTVDINSGSFNNLTFNGSGSWTMTDPTITINNDVTISGGAVTWPTGTTTIRGSLNNTGGSFTHSGALLFTATDAGNIVRFGGSSVGSIAFTGSGSWTMSDTNATVTKSMVVSNGTVTLPSGYLSVQEDFINQANILHNNGTLGMTASSGSRTITTSADDLYSLYIVGAGDFTITDSSTSLRGNLTITNGASLVLPSATLSIGGSLDATGGTMDTATGTILFNSSDGGETITPGANEFYNLVFSGASGGWTMAAATTTNNFTLSAASNFTLTNGASLAVGGVFTNAVADGNTTWTNTTLLLLSGTDYTVNPKTVGDSYATVVVAANSDIRFWNSTIASTTLLSGASIYSQDNGNVAGALGIYGAFDLGTTTEYWSYATDFDGTVLTGGQRRPVTVTFYGAASSSLTMTSGTLNIIGQSAATTTIQSDGSYRYPFTLAGGTLQASYYHFDDLDVSGLVLGDSVLVNNLSNGRFTLAGDTSNLISLSSTTLSNNSSKVFTNIHFDANGYTGGVNVELSGSSLTAWRFINGSGSLYGEAFDADGIDACGSIRFDDSSCLLTEQTHYRWRGNNGGLGVPDSEWFDTNWTKRVRVRVQNQDNIAYGTTTAKVTIPYDPDMQTDFEDLRFTSTDGLTLLPYWTENVDVATDAVVWVTVPSLPASGATDLYVYYGNAGASSNSSASSTFSAFDDFEDGNISEYSGNTSLFTVGGTFAYGGNNGLDTTAFQNSRATHGIYRTNTTVAQGDTIHYRLYVDTTAGASDEVCTLFGVQGPAANYGVCVEQFGVDRLSIVEDAESTDSYGGVEILASTTVSYTTGWYEVFIDWNTDNTISVALYNSSDVLVASTTATDSTYSSGGIGFTYWGQHGGWDSYFAYSRTSSVPLVMLGSEQTRGGADWVNAIDLPGLGFVVGDVARVRLAIENSGLDITDQEFQLEFAPKGAALSCGSVASGTFVPVPPIASCGLSEVCLATSSQYTTGDSTFDLLTDTSGSFSAGEAVQNPDNITSPLNIASGYYTELEYAVQTTVNALDDSYCFRVTNAGAELDSYSALPELSLQYSPIVSNVTLNNGSAISLLPGTTTTVYATGTVTDLNGYADLTTATTTFYRSGVAGGAACTPDNNNCYVSVAPQCGFSNCSGSTCDVSCYADIYFHADPTDNGTYSGEEWFAFVEVEDTGGGYDTETSIGQEMQTLRAIDVFGAIAYVSIAPGEDTNNTNASTSVENEGNVEVNIEVQGTDLSDGFRSTIPANQQKFATSTFTYSACASCQTLSSSSPVALDVDLAKPTVDTPAVTDEVYWGIAVPFGTNSAAHQGINVFTAISP